MKKIVDWTKNRLLGPTTYIFGNDWSIILKQNSLHLPGAKWIPNEFVAFLLWFREIKPISILSNSEDTLYFNCVIDLSELKFTEFYLTWY